MTGEALTPERLAKIRERDRQVPAVAFPSEMDRRALLAELDRVTGLLAAARRVETQGLAGERLHEGVPRFGPPAPGGSGRGAAVSPRMMLPDEVRRRIRATDIGRCDHVPIIGDYGACVCVAADQTLADAAPDLAHTAAVLGERVEAVLALHQQASPEMRYHGTCRECRVVYPCPTARALGVTRP